MLEIVTGAIKVEEGGIEALPVKVKRSFLISWSLTRGILLHNFNTSENPLLQIILHY
jgi:hypothetical protein